MAVTISCPAAPANPAKRSWAAAGASWPASPSACLWFDTQAEEAAAFYTSIFKNSKLGRLYRHTQAGPGPEAR
jgi:3-demethylubiquinone-9 3-methyltransferase